MCLVLAPSVNLDWCVLDPVFKIKHSNIWLLKFLISWYCRKVLIMSENRMIRVGVKNYILIFWYGYIFNNQRKTFCHKLPDSLKPCSCYNLGPLKPSTGITLSEGFLTHTGNYNFRHSMKIWDFTNSSS